LRRTNNKSRGKPQSIFLEFELPELGGLSPLVGWRDKCQAHHLLSSLLLPIRSLRYQAALRPCASPQVTVVGCLRLISVCLIKASTSTYTYPYLPRVAASGRNCRLQRGRSGAVFEVPTTPSNFRGVEVPSIARYTYSTPLQRLGRGISGPPLFGPPTAITTLH
jgi:hypothetical protein